MDSWNGVGRISGWAGLVGAVLLFGAIISMGSLGEPPLEATTKDAAEFFRNAAEADWLQPVEAVGALGMIGLLWFMVGFALLLRRAEGEPPLRSTVALASAVLLPAYYLVNASRASAAHRGLELDPAVAADAFDIGNLGFAVGRRRWCRDAAGPLRLDDRVRMGRALWGVLDMAAHRRRAARDGPGRPGRQRAGRTRVAGRASIRNC